MQSWGGGGDVLYCSSSHCKIAHFNSLMVENHLQLQSPNTSVSVYRARLYVSYHVAKLGICIAVKAPLM